MASGRSLNKGLGKGLGALLGDAALQTQKSGSVMLPISQVQPGLKQPRKRFDEESLADLAESIRTHGIIQPLTVRLLASGYYQIIAGERRWRAAKQAGLSEVPAIIMEADDRKVMELGLIENLQREDLNAMEEAAGYRTLMDEYGLTQEEAAQRVGKSRPAVANALRLLSLPEEVSSLVENGSLSAGHARALLPLPAMLQKQIAQEAVREGLSVRQLETLVKRLQQPQKESARAKNGLESLPLYLKELEKELSSRYSRKVKILQGRKKGRIELEYYDESDLELLLNALDSNRDGKGDAL